MTDTTNAQTTRASPLQVVRVLPRAVKNLRADGMTDFAAAMTYHTLQALFPAVIACFSLAAIFGGTSLLDRILDYVFSASPDIRNSIKPALTSAVSSHGTAGVFGVLGILLALNSASGAFQAAGRALNIVGGVKESRGFIHQKLNAIGATLLLMALAIMTLALIVVGGGFAKDIFHGLGLPEGLAEGWNWARFPVAFVLAVVIYALIYYLAPDEVESRFSLWSAGAAVGVAVWLLASLLFYLYISMFAPYAKTYGAIAGIVILLVWLWLTNLALLLGAEVNAALAGKQTPSGTKQAEAEFPEAEQSEPALG